MNKAQKVLDKLGGKISGGMHKVLKQTAYGRSIEKNLGAMYGWRTGGVMKGAAAHPGEVYSAFRGLDGERASKAGAVGKTVLYRTVNGPELNILLLGVPFLLSAAVGTIKVEVAAAEKAKAQEAKKVQSAATKQTAVAPVLGKLEGEALPSAPYSANFVQVRQELINCGMRPAVAKDLVQGDYSHRSLETVLDEADLEALMKFLDKFSNLG